MAPPYLSKCLEPAGGGGAGCVPSLLLTQYLCLCCTTALCAGLGVAGPSQHSIINTVQPNTCFCTLHLLLCSCSTHHCCCALFLKLLLCSEHGLPCP